MRYAVVVLLDTERDPHNIIEEIVSTLEFEASVKTNVVSVAVLTDDGDEVAVYSRNNEDL